jgi:hypothetical protein
MKKMKYSGEKMSGWKDNPVFAKTFDLVCCETAQRLADAIDAGALLGGIDDLPGTEDPMCTDTRRTQC